MQRSKVICHSHTASHPPTLCSLSCKWPGTQGTPRGPPRLLENPPWCGHPPSVLSWVPEATRQLLGLRPLRDGVTLLI